MASETSERERILVADDEEGLRELLTDVLTEEGYTADSVSTGTEALERLQGDTSYDLLLLDLKMPGISGIEILERLRSNGNDVPVIMITGYGTSSSAIRAMQMGAYDYLIKPFENDEVLVVVRRLFEHQALASRVRALEQRTSAEDRMIGRSPAMREIYKTIGLVAASDASVLITGETGTGKELVANIIHQNSGRKGAFIPVNCAALPETLIESELFGHEKGAFTGAMTQRKGRFELANKGTIFLDEVGEISLPVQKKLLRVLQEGEIERVGGSGSIGVDVRVLAATNRDLMEEVRKGHFREDLYYRLNVVNIHMPPLRERRGDIPVLVEHFLSKYRYKPTAQPTRISEEAMQRMEEYDWPGNVRQLENEIERAVTLSQGRVITSQTLSMGAAGQTTQLDLATRVRNGEGLHTVINDVERIMLHEALRQCDGDVQGAARKLALPVDEFRERLKQLNGGTEA